MGIRRTVNGNKGKYLILIHLNGFRRSQIIGNNYNRFITFYSFTSAACKTIDDPFGNIFNVCRTSAEIFAEIVCFSRIGE